MILIDTNVISELIRPLPDENLRTYLRRQPAGTVFTAAVCEAELHYGLARMPEGARRDDLTARVAAFLATGLPDRVLPFDRMCALAFGELRARREAMGRPVTVLDAMIAATARAHGATLVTRNLRDFADTGVDLLDPWQEPG